MSEQPIVDLTGQNRSLDQLHQEFTDRLKSGGGGGTFDGMEPRLAKLEATMDHVQSTLTDLKGRVGNVEMTLSDLRVHLARLDERVAHLPSKGFIVATVLTGFTIAAAIVGFHDQVLSLFATP